MYVASPAELLHWIYRENAEHGTRSGTGPPLSGQGAPTAAPGRPLRPHHGGPARALPTHPATGGMLWSYKTPGEEDIKHVK